MGFASMIYIWKHREVEEKTNFIIVQQHLNHLNGPIEDEKSDESNGTSA